MSPITPSDTKLPLPQFLKVMTNNNVPVKKAIAAAGKIYKDYSTPSKLNFLTDHALQTAGIEDAGDRKLILAAFRKAGYQPQSQARKPLKRKKGDTEEDQAESPKAPTQSNAEAGPSQSLPSPHTTPAKGPAAKRKRTVKKVKNEFLPDPDAAFNEVINPSMVDFHEVLDESVLEHKTTVVNRAPVMAAWATIVAERLGFKRTEALSIASVYTEMNALSKGASIGKYKKGQDEGMEASRGGSQPYVELMGRRIPLIHTQNSEEWLALSHSAPVSPLTAHGYISRSFRQNTAYFLGALRLLAESYPLEELKEKGWVLYTMFRPEMDEWGKRSEVSCGKILGLRKKSTEEGNDGNEVVQHGPKVNNHDRGSQEPADGSEQKQMSLEEYEAALDDDHTFDDIDLDFAEHTAPN